MGKKQSKFSRYKDTIIALYQEELKYDPVYEFLESKGFTISNDTLLRLLKSWGAYVDRKTRKEQKYAHFIADKEKVIEDYLDPYVTTKSIKSRYNIPGSAFYEFLDQWNVPRNGSSAPRTDLSLHRDQIEEKLLMQIPPRQIARKIGVDLGTLRRWMSTWGLTEESTYHPYRKFDFSDRRDELLRRFYRGDSLIEIGNWLAVASDTVRTALDDYGVVRSSENLYWRSRSNNTYSIYCRSCHTVPNDVDHSCISYFDCIPHHYSFREKTIIVGLISAIMYYPAITAIPRIRNSEFNTFEIVCDGITMSEYHRFLEYILDDWEYFCVDKKFHEKIQTAINAYYADVGNL